MKRDKTKKQKKKERKNYALKAPRPMHIAFLTSSKSEIETKVGKNATVQNSLEETLS